jgi:tetratricopeptide (TPR) repeat protein
MGPRRILIHLGLTGIFLSPGGILPQLAAPVLGTGQSFRAIFEQYRSGNPDAAVEEFSRWDAERVEGDTRLLPDTKDLKSLAALALLYTEAGMRNERFGLPVRTVVLAPLGDRRHSEEWRRLPWPPGDIERQKDLLLGPQGWASRRVMSLSDFDIYSRTALRLIREIVREGRRENNTALLDFCLSWYIVAGSFVSPFHPSTGHMPLRRAALVDFGDHPEVLLLVGSYSSVGPFKDKENTFRRVLALDPLLVEARVRLGDLLRRLGRRDEARSELERAVRDAHAARNVAMEYLGRLFLGRLLEDERELNEAEASYKTAAALSPHWQAARVALGSVRIAAGDWEEGSTQGRVALELSTASRSEPDPWYLYTRAQYWQASVRITSMRMAVRP